MLVAGRHGRLTRDQRAPHPERSPDNDIDRDSDPSGRRPARRRTDPPSRDDPGTTRCPGLPTVLHPRSRASCTAAPPAARPRSAAATNNSARPSPSRPPDPAGRSPSTNAPTAATGTSASNAARAAAPSPAGSASAAPAQIVTGPWHNFRPARPGGGHHHQQIANPRARQPQRPSTARLYTVPAVRAAHATGPPLQRQGSLRDRCATASGRP